MTAVAPRPMNWHRDRLHGPAADPATPHCRRPAALVGSNQVGTRMERSGRIRKERWGQVVSGQERLGRVGSNRVRTEMVRLAWVGPRVNHLGLAVQRGNGDEGD